MQYSLEIIIGTLVALSIFSLTLILERLWNIVYRIRYLDRSNQNQLLDYLSRDNYTDASSFCRLQSHPAFKVVSEIIQHISDQDGKKSAKDLRDIASESILAQIRSLERFIPPLGTVSTVAPSLGLLGTVTGMIKSFAAFEQGASRSKELFGGIDEALITTAIGLVIGIPALVAYNYFVRRVTSITDETNVFVEIVLKSLEKNQTGKIKKK